jgi:hypothetical protein
MTGGYDMPLACGLQAHADALADALARVDTAEADDLIGELARHIDDEPRLQATARRARTYLDNLPARRWLAVHSL